jgi:RimJ/RimL family protein N-acetyltransferase
MARSEWRRSSAGVCGERLAHSHRNVRDQGFLIDTARLRLIAAQIVHLRTELSDPAQLATLLDAEVPASWPPGEYDRDAISYFLSQYELRGADALGWYGWYAVLRPEAPRRALLVGAGGYFGPPGADGTVEIGYSIADEVRGQGYGTELAKALADRALQQAQVRRVIAHVAPDNVASHVVLKRAGFHFAAAGTSGKLRFERAAKAR